MRDAHITMFLRTLEYYGGILFLTTNRVNNIDEAMQSRIDLPIRYSDLSKDTRKTVWRSILEQSSLSAVDETHIEKLAGRELNGRQVRVCNSPGQEVHSDALSQIKNAVKLAHEWASHKNSQLTCSQLETVLDIYLEFERDMVGHGPIENRSSYI